MNDHQRMSFSDIDELYRRLGVLEAENRVLRSAHETQAVEFDRALESGGLRPAVAAIDIEPVELLVSNSFQDVIVRRASELIGAVIKHAAALRVDKRADGGVRLQIYFIPARGEAR